MPAEDFIGLKGHAYDVDIERGKIREFSRAICAEIPDFLKGDSPVIPAIFLVSAPYIWGYSLERPRGSIFKDIDHDLSVSLHAEESFLFHGPPPCAGDKLSAQAILESVKRKSGRGGGEMTFLTILTEYRRRDNQELVAEQRSTSVTTARTPGEDGWNVTIPDFTPQYDTLDPLAPFASIQRMEWEQLSENQGPGPIDAGPLFLRDIVRFQGVVGEDDPLHHDAKWAKFCHYPGVFGLGTHQAGTLCGYAAHWFDPKMVRTFKVRFCDVYWPGDTMVYEGWVARKFRDENTGAKMADIELQCRRSEGEILLKAQMTCDFGGA